MEATKRKQPKLSAEEKELEQEIERGEWKSMGGARTEMFRRIFEAAANETKEERINIRLQKSVLDRLKKLAAEDGIPYQTFITSILFRFATGQFLDRDSVVDLLRAIEEKAG